MPRYKLTKQTRLPVRPAADVRVQTSLVFLSLAFYLVSRLFGNELTVLLSSIDQYPILQNEDSSRDMILLPLLAYGSRNIFARGNHILIFTLR